MAYNKTTWATGDIITAEKLNHLEDGVADSGSKIILTAYEDDYDPVADFTYEEFIEAMESGKEVFIEYSNTFYPFVRKEQINDNESRWHFISVVHSSSANSWMFVDMNAITSNDTVYLVQYFKNFTD